MASTDEAALAAAFARCSDAAAADPALARRLGESLDADAFDVAMSREFGDDARLVSSAGRRADRPPLPRNERLGWPLEERRGWQPLALEWSAGGAELVWGCGEVADTLPFHEQVVAALRYRPFNRWFAQRTPLTPAFVAELEADALPLAGLILHESRCGSTLVAQALKAWPGTRVVSEPGLLDVALTAALSGMDPSTLAFRGALAALRQPAREDTRVVVKLDAWHALALGALRSLLPGVAWLFAYRTPLEVLVSHAREPGRHTVPGMLPDAWLAPPAPDAVLLPIEHAGRVLGSLCAAVVPHAQPRHLVNYAELADPSSDVLSDRIPRVFGLDPAAVDARRYAMTLAQHAKRPYEAFADDRATKNEGATTALRDIAARWMEPQYAELESIRLRDRS
ncbi:hypothetical protein FHW12_003464 [Dokdonella fugitiva]|uniref:Sulfotransferase family protein n=1 Tax=Dokdonella fugitiva TaxID=328517 RepID=A0A839FAP1_9GAMM|nr:hypothetical protein [Dokdonella fugitiva]MBA8889221.1 hypothetical protein [Dokdonella fugitiva]